MNILIASEKVLPVMKEREMFTRIMVGAILFLVMVLILVIGIMVPFGMAMSYGMEHGLKIMMMMISISWIFYDGTMKRIPGMDLLNGSRRHILFMERLR